MPRHLVDGATTVEGPRSLPADVAERILRALPAWFGIEAALVTYAREAAELPTFVAIRHGAPVGFLTLREHGIESVELSCIAVLPGLHGKGVGTALCDALQAWWTHRGGTLLQVKTLGPSNPDPNYALTRGFYRARGFVPVEEFHGLWADLACLVMVKLPGTGTPLSGVS